MTAKRYKMTFEVVCKFDNLVDKETFEKEYKSDLNRLCKFMCKHEGLTGWYDEELKFKCAEFITKK